MEADENLDLADIAAEVDVLTDADQPKRTKRKTKLLNKQQRRDVVSSLQDTASDCSDIIDVVISSIDKQNHIHLFKEREALWNTIRQEKPLLKIVVKGLVNLFMKVYRSCETGKDKYSRFQLEWYWQCSHLLKETIEHDDDILRELSPIHQGWLGYCEGRGTTQKEYNPIMVCLCSATYAYAQCY